MTPEGKVKEACKAVFKAFDAMYWMPRGTAFGRGGVADFNVLLNGTFIAVETKAERGKLTELQKAYLDDVVRHGGLAFVIHPYEIIDLEHALEDVQEGKGEELWKKQMANVK